MAKEMIVVEGGTPLIGEVKVSGAKNSALKLIAASILGGGESVIHNVPLISDITIMSKVLETLGARVSRDGHTLVIDTASVDTWETPYELVSKMRASISVLGPLVARFGEAQCCYAGGCNLGARKIDMHMVGMRRSGFTSRQITATSRQPLPTVCTALTSRLIFQASELRKTP